MPAAQAKTADKHGSLPPEACVNMKRRDGRTRLSPDISNKTYSPIITTELLHRTINLPAIMETDK